MAVYVIAKSFANQLKDTLKEKSYSILIDESTDVSCFKLLAVLVRRNDTVTKKIVDDFLGVIEVVHATGEGLFDAVLSVLEQFSLDFKDCVSFGSEGASSVAGRNNSVWSEIEQANLRCIQVCCHQKSTSIVHLDPFYFCR